MKLNWLKKQGTLTKEEQNIVNSLEGKKIGDLDKGSGEVGIIFPNWYKAEFTYEALLSDCEYIAFDFAAITNLRKTRLFLNGHEIGNNTCSHAEAVYAVPSEFLKENNSLLCIVDEGAIFTLWAEEGTVQYTPKGYTQEINELPSELIISKMMPDAAVKEIKKHENTFDVLLLNNKKICISFMENGIFRVNCNPDKEKLIDDVSINELYENTVAKNDVIIDEDDRNFILKTDDYSVFIYKEEFGITVKNNNGEIVFSQTNIMGSTLKGLNINLKNDEHIFGIGENATPSIDKTCTKEDIWISHDFVKCDAPIPFYISSKNYGLYLNSSFRSVFDMGYMRDDKAVIYTLDDRLDWFFFFGNPHKVVENYYAVTGKTVLPPKWAFGFWQAGFNVLTQESAENEIETYKKYNIPLDVMCIDPPWQNLSCDLKWNKKTFPNPDEFIKKLKSEKLKLILWTAPFVNPECDWYEDGKEKEIFFKDENMDMAKVQWWKGYDSGLVDFTNEKSVSWWEQRLKKLIEMGVSGFKIDGGDNGEFPYDTFSHDNHTGGEIHNLYAVYFAKSIQEIIKKYVPDKRAVTWERTAYVGSGKYPCTWGGDQFADFGGTRVLIKAGQMAGICGLPFWSQDVGGFCTCENTTEEFFIRSYQWGCIAPLSRAHGGKTEPWSFSEKACDIAANYIRLRYSLIPYIYSLAYNAYNNAKPIMYPVFYDYMDDENTYKCDYQYFLGESIMVAPIYEESNNPDYTAVRDIYLPKGNWIDFHNDTVYKGNQHITYTAKAEILPMFIKEGAIIPRKNNLMHADDYSMSDIELYIYPSEENTSFCIYDDDGESEKYKDKIYDMIEISAEEKNNKVNIKIKDIQRKINKEVLKMKLHIFKGECIKTIVNGEAHETKYNDNYLCFEIKHYSETSITLEK